MRTDLGSNVLRAGMLGATGWALYSAYDAQQRSEQDPVNRAAYENSALSYAGIGLIVGLLTAWGWSDPLHKRF